jgi:hypothetical protein
MSRSLAGPSASESPRRPSYDIKSPMWDTFGNLKWDLPHGYDEFDYNPPECQTWKWRTRRSCRRPSMTRRIKMK